MTLFKSKEEKEAERALREEAEREAREEYRKAYIEARRKKAREKAKEDVIYGTGITGTLARLANSDVGKNWGKGLKLGFGPPPARKRKKDMWEWGF